MEEIKPISPEEARKALANNPDPRVVAFINGLLSKRCGSSPIHITQDEVVDHLVRAYEIDRQSIFDDNLLDIEYAYERQGWSVRFDEPAYNEDYDAHWIFKP